MSVPILNLTHIWPVISFNTFAFHYFYLNHNRILLENPKIKIFQITEEPIKKL